jgi:hypothetical protein
MDRITGTLVRATVAPRLVPIGCGAIAALVFLLFGVLCFFINFSVRWFGW